MDFYSLGFLFVIVMVSGVIAYLADIYGKKLGKKRFSLWGMRPRHTAAVSTVFLGMSLSILTIGLVTLFSSPVRHWILEGRKSLAQLQVLNTQLNSLHAQLGEEQTRLNKALKLEKQYSKEKGVYEAEISGNKKTLGEQQIQIAGERQNIDLLKSTQVRLEADLRKTRRDISNKDLEITSDQKRLVRDSQSLKKINLALQISWKKSHEMFADNEKLTKTNGQLTQSRLSLDKEVASLTKQKSDLEASDLALQADLLKSKKDLDELRSQLQDDTQRLAAVRLEYSQLNSKLVDGYMVARTYPVTYRRYQEVARVEVGAHLTPEEADKAIDDLMAKAQLEASHHGAKARGETKIADIWDRPESTSAQVKRQLQNELVSSPEETVLIATSSFNAFQDEPLAIDVTIKKNPTVYHRGDVLAESELDGAKSNQEIFKQLSAFGEKLRDRARKDKMIPQSEDDSYGSLPADQVLSIVSEVKQVRGPVRLQAIVQSDTHAADPLKLDFRLR